jgi:exosortase A-associated hydrolase 1
MTANVLREYPGHHEEALAFACQGEQLVGVVSLPAAPASGALGDLALLVVVGGPQVRAGSHRQFTQLCRAVAEAGVPALRFDVRGMGDSTGPLRSFEHIGDDISAALDALQARLPGVRRVVLWGLCDGASAALMHVHSHRDARVWLAWCC